MIKNARLYGIKNFKNNWEIKNPSDNALLNPVYRKFLFLNVAYVIPRPTCCYVSHFIILFYEGAFVILSMYHGEY